MPNSSVAANKSLYIGLSIGVVLLTGALSYIFYKRSKRSRIPTKWRRVGTLEQIYLYPIKSSAPIQLAGEDEFVCEDVGLRFRGIRDHALLVVNELHEVVTNRAYGKLLAVTTKIVGETKLVFTAEGMEPLELDFATLADRDPGNNVQHEFCGSKLDSMMCGEIYDKWFSRFLLERDDGLHLVYYPYPDLVKPINKIEDPFTDSSNSSDITSYMLTNLSSVQDLNDRLPGSIINPILFRGNFHLKMDTHKPYAEYDWQWLRIGDKAVFRNVGPVTRFIFPSVSVPTGEIDPNGNPLRELRSYRLLNNQNSQILGIHLALRQTGTLKPNAIVYIEDV